LIFAAAFAVVFACDAVGTERRERRHFVAYVDMWRAEQTVQRLSADAAEVLAVALPRDLLLLGSDRGHRVAAMSRVSHRSGDASVGVCDAYDFAQWCCGVLVTDVIAALHDLLRAYDVAADNFDVVRAMTYGDSCVVCAGLVSDCPDHATRVADFCEWVVSGSAAESDAAVRLQLRGAVCTGQLIGGIVGGASQRYVVTGPAVAAAEGALQLTGPRCVTAVEDSVAVDAAAVPFVDPTEASHNEGAVAASPSTAAAAGADGALPFSRWTLRFFDPAEEAAKAAAADSQPTVRMAAIPLAVYGAFLLVVLLELAVVSDDDRRRHTRPMPLAALACSTIGLAALVAARVVRVRAGSDAIAGHAELAATVAAILLGSASLVAMDCVFANADLSLLVLVGCPVLLPRWPWLAQLAAQGVAVVLPVLYFVSVVYEFTYPLTQSSTLVTRVLLVAIFVGIRYFAERTACRYHAARAASEAAVRCATQRAGVLAGLLAGFVPAHAVDDARGNAEVRGETRDAHVKQWLGLTVLQVALHASGPFMDFGRVAAVWRRVAATIAELLPDTLETVQATGDTFLLAGPFVGAMAQRERDAVRCTTARCVLGLLRTLSELLRGLCQFTAVATSGSGHGALLGARNLHYRLFGAAVRESNALLAAAPRADGRCVAFATESFCRQQKNFEVPKAALASGADGRMSVAMPAASQSDGSHVYFRGADDTFHPMLLWRVRGVGVASIAAFKLAATAGVKGVTSPVVT
jgi:hypothetical protein